MNWLPQIQATILHSELKLVASDPGDHTAFRPVTAPKPSRRGCGVVYPSLGSGRRADHTQCRGEQAPARCGEQSLIVQSTG
jgi:hypothetical protein